jgi:hypothetical protein
MFPSILVEVVSFLNDINVNISENHEDGRVNSIHDEKTVIDILEKKYGKENVIRPKVRDWWDVKLFGYVTNIKSSKFGSAADNFTSKAAVVYALTDLDESEVKKHTWKQFESALKNHSNNDNNRDYYILALNKVTNEVHLASLKTLTKITPNGSNLLFQIEWRRNTKPVYRTHRQAYEFLVECYKQSVRKKISAHDGFESL